MNSTVKILVILLAIIVLIMLPKPRCKSCGHIITPGLSIMCDKCGAFLEYDNVEFYTWWLKTEKDKNNNENTDTH